MRRKSSKSDSPKRNGSGTSGKLVCTISGLLMSSAADSLAPTSARQEGKRASGGKNPASSLKCSASSRKSGLVSYAPKTLPTFSVEDWMKSSKALPPSGMMHGGRFSPRAPLALHTCGKECSWWPTPTAKSSDTCGGSNQRRACEKRGTVISKRRLNPEYSEWLMGFPTGWTDIDASGTASSFPSPSTLPLGPYFLRMMAIGPSFLKDGRANSDEWELYDTWEVEEQD